MTDGISRVTRGLPPRVAEALQGLTDRFDKALRSSPLWRQAIRGGRSAPHLLRGHFNLGWCPICETASLFVWTGVFLRAHYRCLRCYSIPRWRAVMHMLATLFPHWRDLAIHESSPGGAASQKLQAECPQYLPTHFWPGVAPGQSKYGVRCEDLERLTFPDDSFDLVVTQDVFEHVLQPAKAFAEVLARSSRVARTSSRFPRILARAPRCERSRRPTAFGTLWSPYTMGTRSVIKGPSS